MSTVPTLPIRPDIKTQEPFRYFCNMVLPAVYGDELSYYELLCKVTEYLNETMSNVNDLNDNMKSFYEWMQQLQNWIDEYFDNLDVQQEINQKLDEMAENGQLQAIMERFFSRYDQLLVEEKKAREQGDAKLSAQIANIIAHNDDTEGNSELIDIRTGFDGTTYATAGAAVRGQTRQIANDIKVTDSMNHKRIDFTESMFAQGSVDLLDGTVGTKSTTMIYGTFRIQLFQSRKLTIYVANGYRVRCAFYNNDGGFLGYHNFVTGISSSLLSDYTSGYAVLVIANATSGTEIVPSEAPNAAYITVHDRVDDVNNYFTAFRNVVYESLGSEIAPTTFDVATGFYSRQKPSTITENSAYKSATADVAGGETIWVTGYMPPAANLSVVVFEDANGAMAGHAYDSDTEAKTCNDAEVTVPPTAVKVHVMTKTATIATPIIKRNLTKVRYGNTKLPLAGKNVAFLGDSIFGNNQTKTGIVNLFADATSANCANFALGGTRAKRRATGTDWTISNNCWGALDGESVAACIANDDYSDMVDAYGGNISGAPSYFATTIANIQTYDWSQCDYIICNFGTNDYTGRVNVDDYIEAMGNIIETILTAYPNIVFVKCTPTQRFFAVSGGFESGSNHPLAEDKTLKDYVDAHSALVDDYNVQVVDCFNIGINDFTRPHFFTASDWTHQNENGRKRIATYLAANIS